MTRTTPVSTGLRNGRTPPRSARPTTTARAPDPTPPPWINFSFPAFALPAGDLVTGIEVRIKIRTVNPDEVQLTDSGTLTGVTKVVPSVFEGQSFCSSTAFTPAIGGDGDLWGTSPLTAADFNAGTVGFRITHTHNATTDLDAVELTVYHGPPNMPPVAICQDVNVSADGNCQFAPERRLCGGDRT